MYRTSDPVGDYERAPTMVQTAIAPDALIYVGALSLVVAALVVACHLYRIFGRHGGRAVFDADDKLLLVYFYAVIVVFTATALLSG